MKFTQFGGGSSIVNSFSDNFNRANAVSPGSNWLYTTPYANSQLMTTQFSISVNQLAIQDSTVNQNQNFPECIVPIVGAPNLNGLNQFSQFDWISGNSVTGTRDLFVGPAVCIGMLPASNFNCYLIELDDEVGSMQVILRKWTAGAYSLLFVSGNNAFAAGNTIKLNAHYNGISSVDLTISVNGTVLSTTRDNSPLLTGIPGISRGLYVSTATPGSPTQTVDNFSCGPGV
jgi:hypothetical protein